MMHLQPCMAARRKLTPFQAKLKRARSRCTPRGNHSTVFPKHRELHQRPFDPRRWIKVTFTNIGALRKLAAQDCTTLDSCRSPSLSHSTRFKSAAHRSWSIAIFEADDRQRDYR